MIGTLGLLVALGLVIWLNPGLVSVAATVAGWHVFNSPFLHWAATRRSAPWNSYVRETYRPLLAGVWAAIACVILHRNLPATIPGDVIAVVAGTLVFTAIYALLILLIARGEVYASNMLDELTAAKMIVMEGTLYPLLTRLKNAGLLEYKWVESKSGPPRKYYKLTDKGIKFLEKLTETWEELIHSTEMITSRTTDNETNIHHDSSSL